MPLMQVSRPLARKSAFSPWRRRCAWRLYGRTDYHKPTAVAPADWTSWHSGSDALRPALADAARCRPTGGGVPDPVLDELERRAFTASPDLRTAALHFAQARVQRDVTASQGLPQVNATATVQGQRQSEFGASTRLFDEIGGANRDALAKLLGEPYTLYKGGFDASWEIDFWGKVRRSVEAANADIAQQGALLDQARPSPATWHRPISRCAVPNATLPWPARTSTTRERTRILAERTKGGLANHFDLERQHIDLRFAEAQLPALGRRKPRRSTGSRCFWATAPVRCPTCSIRRKAKRRAPSPIWRSACRRRSPCAVPTFAPPKPACTRRPQRSASRADLIRDQAGREFRSRILSRQQPVRMGQPFVGHWPERRSAPVRRRAAQTHHPPARTGTEGSGRFASNRPCCARGRK
jgi:hypothetical protein